MACAKTGSGTSRSPIAVPASGEPTSSTVLSVGAASIDRASIGGMSPLPVSEQILDIHAQGVRLRTDHYLNDRSGLHHAVRAGRLERRVAHLRAVPHDRPQTGDAGLDLHDVVGPAESGDDRLC